MTLDSDRVLGTHDEEIARLDSGATRKLPATVLSLPDRRIRSRPNRRSPEEFGVAPEQSILKLP